MSLAACSCASPARALMIAGIGANVAALAYFRYTNFLVEIAGDVAGGQWSAPHIILPLAISFFTFQQIAHLTQCSPIGRSRSSSSECRTPAPRPR